MKALPWIERWKNSGTLLSEAEVAYLGELVAFIDRAIVLRAPFVQLAPTLCAFADGLASVDFEFMIASAAERIPEFGIETPKLSEAKNPEKPLAEEEQAFLEDLKGVVDNGIRNGVTLRVIAGFFSHDFHELERNDFDFQAAKRRGFRPKASGYSRINEDSVQGIDD